MVLKERTLCSIGIAGSASNAKRQVANANVIRYNRRAKQFIHNRTNVGGANRGAPRSSLGIIQLPADMEAAPTSATARSRAACLAA